MTVNECCLQRDELWDAVTGYDLAKRVEDDLMAMRLQLNAARRHQDGVPAREGSKLPHSAIIPLTWWGAVLPIPLDYDSRPVTYEQALSNLAGATAVALAHAVARGRWAVNEHVRAERMLGLLREVVAAQDESPYEHIGSDLLERLRAEVA